MNGDVDLAKLHAIISSDYVAAAGHAFGSAAQLIVTTLTSAVTKFLEIVDPATLGGRLTIAYVPSSGAGLPGCSPQPEPACHFASVAHVPATLVQPAVIKIESTGKLTVYAGEPVAAAALSVGGIAYVYEAGAEHIFVDGSGFLLANPSGFESLFVKPTYGSLEVALRKYRLTQVRESSCYLFSQVWADSKRLFLRNLPEEDMRKSLTNYLRGVMDAEVMPEQNVDDTHPVDIKVTFPLTQRRALVEIKWMGDSYTAKGNLLRYRDARVREGANQLARYLDRIRSSTPTFHNRGYLVVFDARRKGLNLGVTSISAAQASFYERKSVSYDPAILARPDFAPPRRLFATAIAP